ncbi:hypothetical protein MSG28_014197 [Choristoneura fumiferana]|uniref:Uncharacterized protein n=2 Tax=Choristoneura fumiferana TaxID=7141 RepID=A0ACC0JGC0_CHOFU|nr:hypothetical protein MSG28_014197 [Choristoneura fumiferana]KAI8423115.1 hypothetical protein MSG28_014197 [Choristoneura fumiferana]
MVVFTCGHCGESVQKPKVEKHYMTKCRNRAYNLSCMDCFKDFLGNDYEAHTKCITEEERYSGKGFVAKEKKGEKKQNVWVEMLQEVLEEQRNAPANVRRIIETVSKHNNTPRKKPKFINFVKNVCGQKTNVNDMNQAWDMIAVKLAELSVKSAQNRPQSQKKDEENDDKEEKDDKSIEEQNGVENETVEDDKKDAETEETSDKKSKKQRKEEKKRKKYEAQLQSAAQPAEEEVEEIQLTKKEKKKKNRAESVSNADAEELNEEDNKIKKRKRQDTVNGVPESKDSAEIETENVVNDGPVSKATQKKKKIKSNEETDESICLHDQNVAKIGDLDIRKDKFDWHAVIMSVLDKKGEMQFKRLQKKVLGEYSEATGQEIDDRIADKFIKKLKSAPNVRVDKNRVFIMD